MDTYHLRNEDYRILAQTVANCVVEQIRPHLEALHSKLDQLSKYPLNNGAQREFYNLQEAANNLVMPIHRNLAQHSIYNYNNHPGDLHLFNYDNTPNWNHRGMDKSAINKGNNINFHFHQPLSEPVRPLKNSNAQNFSSWSDYSENENYQRNLMKFDALQQQQSDKEKKQRFQAESLKRQKIHQLEFEKERTEKERLKKIEIERQENEKLKKIEMERLKQQEQQKMELELLENEKLKLQQLKQMEFEREIAKNEMIKQIELDKLEFEKMKQIEFDRIEREKRELERMELEKRKQLEQERKELERLEKEKIIEIERIKQLEFEKQEIERRRKLEIERIEQERKKAKQIEYERLQNEKLERERQEKENQKRAEMERLERENKKKIEYEKMQLERLEQERTERERRKQSEIERINELEAERNEIERLKRQQIKEKQRLEIEKAELERLEYDRREKEHLFQIETEELQLEKLEREKMKQMHEENERIRQNKLKQQEQERSIVLEKEKLQYIEQQKLVHTEKEKFTNRELEKLEQQKQRIQQMKQVELERLDQERQEKEKAKQIEIERFRAEKEKLQKEKLDMERKLIENEKKERQFLLQKQKLQQDKLELEKLEQERLLQSQQVLAAQPVQSTPPTTRAIQPSNNTNAQLAHLFSNVSTPPTSPLPGVVVSHDIHKTSRQNAHTQAELARIELEQSAQLQHIDSTAALDLFSELEREIYEEEQLIAEERAKIKQEEEELKQMKEEKKKAKASKSNGSAITSTVEESTDQSYFIPAPTSSLVEKSKKSTSTSSDSLPLSHFKPEFPKVDGQIQRLPSPFGGSPPVAQQVHASKPNFASTQPIPQLAPPPQKSIAVPSNNAPATGHQQLAQTVFPTPTSSATNSTSSVTSITTTSTVTTTTTTTNAAASNNPEPPKKKKVIKIRNHKLENLRKEARELVPIFEQKKAELNQVPLRAKVQKKEEEKKQRKKVKKERKQEKAKEEGKKELNNKVEASKVEKKDEDSEDDFLAAIEREMEKEINEITIDTFPGSANQLNNSKFHTQATQPIHPPKPLNELPLPVPHIPEQPPQDGSAVNLRMSNKTIDGALSPRGSPRREIKSLPPPMAQTPLKKETPVAAIIETRSERKTLNHATMRRPKQGNKRLPQRRKLQKDGTREQFKFDTLVEEPTIIDLDDGGDGNKRITRLGVPILPTQYNPATLKTQLKPTQPKSQPPQFHTLANLPSSPARDVEKGKKNRLDQPTPNELQMLLEWAKSILSEYRIPITNWTTSWWDGLGYCALIHKYCPSYINFYSLSATNQIYNLKLAFDIAQKLGVPRLLNESDFNISPPDPASNIAYLKELRKVLSRYEKVVL